MNTRRLTACTGTFPVSPLKRITLTVFVIASASLGTGTIAADSQVFEGAGELFDVPTREQIEELVAKEPSYVGLSKQEREQQIDFTYRTLAFQALMAEMQLRAACSNEIESYCGIPDKGLNCLVNRSEDLGNCCSVAMRNTLGEPVLEEPVEHHGRTIPMGSMLYYHDESCGTSTVILAYPTVFDNISYGPGEVQFNAQGHIESGYLTPDQKIGELWVAGGENLLFDETGKARSVLLSRDSTVDGVTWAATKRPLELHANGRVAQGMLVESARIGDAVWAPGWIKIDESGLVTYGSLAEPLHFEGLTVPSGAALGEYGPERQFQFEIDEPTTINGFTAPTGSMFTVNGAGHLDQVYLSEAVFFRDVLYPRATQLSFDLEGNVVKDSLREEWAKWQTRGINLNQIGTALEQPLEIANIVLPVGSLIFKSYNGEVDSAIIPRQMQFGDITIGPGRLNFQKEFRGTTLHLSGADIVVPQRYGSIVIGAPHRIFADIRNGRLSSAKLAEDAVQNGLHFAAGSHVSLNDKGLITRGTITSAAIYNGVHLPEDAYVSLNFDDVMKLEKIEAQAPVKTSMAVFDGDDMRFHPTEAGKEAMVREAVLHEDTTFDGTTYAAGTQILFSSTGKVRASRMYQRRWPDGYPAPVKKDNSPTILVGPQRTALIAYSPALCDDLKAKLAAGETISGFSAGAGFDLKTGCDGYENDGVIAQAE